MFLSVRILFYSGYKFRTMRFRWYRMPYAMSDKDLSSWVLMRHKLQYVCARP